MTVQREIERAKAIAEAARGNYLLFSEQTEDEKAREVYRDMAEDMERHTRILESRLEYLQQEYGGGEEEEPKQKKGKRTENEEKL